MRHKISKLVQELEKKEAVPGLEEDGVKLLPIRTPESPLREDLEVARLKSELH